MELIKSVTSDVECDASESDEEEIVVLPAHTLEPIVYKRLTSVILVFLVLVVIFFIVAIERAL